MTTCSFCGKRVEETKTPLDDWETLAVIATRHGRSEQLLTTMVCPSCAPDPGTIAVVPVHEYAGK